MLCGRDASCEIHAINYVTTLEVKEHVDVHAPIPALKVLVYYRAAGSAASVTLPHGTSLSRPTFVVCELLSEQYITRNMWL